MTHPASNRSLPIGQFEKLIRNDDYSAKDYSFRLQKNLLFEIQE